MPTTLNTMKDEQGNLCYMIINGAEIILVDVDDYNEAKDLDIPRSKIIAHGRQGRRHFKNYVREIEARNGLDKLMLEDRRREERHNRLAEEKERKEQERLAMIKAHRRRDPYWFDITWGQMFKGWS